VKTIYLRLTHRGRIARLVAVGAALGALSVSPWVVSPAGANQTRVTISAMKTTKNGTVLVGGHTTVYTLQPSSTACTSACLRIWPAVLLPNGQTKPIAGHGVQQSQLGSMSVAKGRQATYQGHLLYWYTGDKKAGQVSGNLTDQWGKWTAAVTAKSAQSSTSGSGPAGSGGTTGGVSF
jgi:predicted lipoprotein with Yx(FWY)xxD motif